MTNPSRSRTRICRLIRLRGIATGVLLAGALLATLATSTQAEEGNKFNKNGNILIADQFSNEEIGAKFQLPGRTQAAIPCFFCHGPFQSGDARRGGVRPVRNIEEIGAKFQLPGRTQAAIPCFFCHGPFQSGESSALKNIRSAVSRNPMD